MRVVEVFADIWCPFAHVGLARLVQRRAEAGGSFVLHVRSWPLEWVNGAPLDAGFIAEEVADLRRQVSPDLFVGFDTRRFPATTLPALAVAAAAYEHDLPTGERVSLALRHALFEAGRDIADPHVLREVAGAAGVTPPETERGEEADPYAAVRADWEQGRQREVMGSPHFFLGDDSFFCPALRIRRSDGGLSISFDADRFDAFVDRCLAG